MFSSKNRKNTHESFWSTFTKTDHSHRMKVFDRPIPTDHSHRMKVFASLFSKSDWGLGQRPIITPFFWFFFCGYLLKKRTERNFSMLHILTFYPLFSLTPQAQEKSLAKKKRREYFAPAGATWGSAPSPRRLLKKAGENFHPVGVIRWGKKGQRTLLCPFQ